MNVNKRSITIDKIAVDLVLCPKTGLYLQNLYCRRCGYFKSDYDKFVDCSFKKLINPEEDPVKNILIKEFSKESIKSQISEDEENPILNLSQRLKNSKTSTDVKLSRERDETELTEYLKKKNLSLRLEKAKKEKNR